LNWEAIKRCAPKRLTAKFSLLLCFGGICAGMLFFLLQWLGSSALDYVVQQPGFQQWMDDAKSEALQTYVTKKDLTPENGKELNAWIEKQPILLMEIYRENQLIYASWAPEELLAEEEVQANMYSSITYHTITFSDGTAQVAFFGYDATYWMTLITLTSLGLSIFLFLLIFVLGSRRMVKYIGVLSRQIQEMEGGDLDRPILIQGQDELSQMAKGLDGMRQSFREQRLREKQLYRANQTMVTQMSHDLRTPLTAMQLYVDILRYQPGGKEKTEMYLEKLQAKLLQLKDLSESLFQYSLTGEETDLEIDPPAPFEQVFFHPLSDMAAYLEQHSFTFVFPETWPACRVTVYAPYIRRIIDNLASNMVKYGDTESPVTAEVKRKGGKVTLLFSNKIKMCPVVPESSGIGLGNVQAMMAEMQGTLEVTKKGTTFKAALTFPLFFS
jgi:signal transduction histidine kinase